VKVGFVAQFVQRRAPWILKRQEHYRELSQRYPKKEFTSGESFPLFGKSHRLKIIHKEGVRQPSCALINGRLVVNVNGQMGEELQKMVQTTIKKWYLSQAEEKILEKVGRYQKVLGILPRRIKIGDQKTRWGSCSRSGNLRFNWRLATMPISILEYVVVHELAHLRAHNHSDRFWRIIQSVLPDYKQRRDWLQKNGITRSLS